MIFWLLLALIAAAVAIALAVPLVTGSGRRAADAAAHDRAVYRDQLEEVERDLARGLLTEAEAEAARLEIKRRILRTGQPAETPAAAGRDAAARGQGGGYLALALALLVPIGALGLYLLTGTPGMPDMPLAERLRNAPIFAAGPDAEQMRQAQEMDPQARAEMIAGMVAGLEARLAEQPDDFDGWMRLGRSRLVLGQPEAAVEAYARAAALRPDSLPAATAHAAAAVQADGEGPVSARAQEALRRLLALDPQESSALFLMGRAASEAGDWPAALDWFRRLREALPAEDPRATVVDSIIAELRSRGDVPAAAPATPEAPPPSPQAPEGRR